MTAKDINCLELTEATKRFVGWAWGGPLFSMKAEETGSVKGQEIRETELPRSQLRAHVREGLL